MKIEYIKTNKEDLNKIAKYTRELLAYHSEKDPFYKNLSEAQILQDLEKEADERNRLLISAFVDGELIGFIRGIIRKNIPDRTEDYAFIHDIYIDPNYRKLGIGKGLISEFQKEANITRLELIVDTRNNLGMEFWKANGFETYQIKMFRK